MRHLAATNMLATTVAPLFEGDRSVRRLGTKNHSQRKGPVRG